MTIKEFQKQIIDALTSKNTVLNILESENSLLVHCNNESNFLLHILESKFTFIHDDRKDEEIQKYISTHTKKEYTEDLLCTTKKHPAFFIYFMLFTKLEEKGVIDRCSFYHIVDNIVFHEQEFEEFMIRILCYFNVVGDNSNFRKGIGRSQKDDEK